MPFLFLSLYEPKTKSAEIFSKRAITSLIIEFVFLSVKNFKIKRKTHNADPKLYTCLFISYTRAIKVYFIRYLDRKLPIFLVPRAMPMRYVEIAKIANEDVNLRQEILDRNSCQE